MIERDVENLLEMNLTRRGWVCDPESPERNVYRQNPRSEEERKKLKGKHPDYILYSRIRKTRPVAIIETKKSDYKDVQSALGQAKQYARSLGVNIVFIYSHNIFVSYDLKADASLYIDDLELTTIPSEDELIRFVREKSNKVYSPKIDIKSRNELIAVFAYANNQLRKAGLTTGMTRFMEFANILFLKLVSESKGDIGVAIPDHIKWDTYKNMEDDALLNYINKVVIPGLSRLFGENEIFDQLKITDTQALKNIVNKLDELDLYNIHTDIKGDAFEYFIQKYNSGNNDLGEYFTPRHIVNFLVKIANPHYGEKIYDPFCGTGGILIASYHYIVTTLEQQGYLNGATVRELREETLYGSEISATAKIARKNMILAGAGHRNIIQQDSFLHPVDGKYNIVITNIPFNLEGSGKNLYEIKNNSGNSQAIQHVVRALNKDAVGARAFIIVPEGVLDNKDLESTRKMLLEKKLLRGVISFPCGVFYPYTESKTSVLCLDMSGVNDEVFFYQVKNDGYTLTTRRRKLDGINDFDEFIALDVFNRDKKAVHERLLWVPVEEILNSPTKSLMSFRYDKKIKEGYIPLSQVIREVDERNTQRYDTATISNEIYFGVALGEDFWGDNFVSVTSRDNDDYKVVAEKQFAYNPTRARVGSIGINLLGKKVAVSKMYRTFEVYNPEFLPEYVYISLKTPEISEEIKNRSFGTIRQTLEFKDLQGIQIKKALLSEQEKVVRTYLQLHQKLLKAQREFIEYPQKLT